MTHIRDRVRGALLGLAVGDALGTTLEFQPPGTFDPINDMAGGGPFRLKPGEWTDDTSMALCLAESLLECDGFDALDQMLWAFARSRTFEDGALLAVNLGDDADTTGAIYGQIAGAFYGASGIPVRWVETLAKREVLEDFAGRLASRHDAQPLALARSRVAGNSRERAPRASHATGASRRSGERGRV